MKDRCFVCEKVLGGTFVNASHGIPAMCLRCGGRVRGLVMQAQEPLLAILREVQWNAGDDLTGTICVECGVPRDDRERGHDHKNPGPHAIDCKLAIAIGAPRVD